MRGARGSFVIGLGVVLALVYVYALYKAREGWGYQGYGGYHNSPSWLYWGPETYHDPSVRAGSVGGVRSHSGLSGGK
jgi:hypothetical protein